MHNNGIACQGAAIYSSDSANKYIQVSVSHLDIKFFGIYLKTQAHFFLQKVNIAQNQNCQSILERFTSAYHY